MLILDNRWQVIWKLYFTFDSSVSLKVKVHYFERKKEKEKERERERMEGRKEKRKEVLLFPSSETLLCWIFEFFFQPLKILHNSVTVIFCWWSFGFIHLFITLFFIPPCIFDFPPGSLSFYWNMSCRTFSNEMSLVVADYLSRKDLYSALILERCSLRIELQV